jgi:hypothetical protein
MFELVRTTDPSGISGTGVIAQGVEFSDGTVALRWNVPPGSPGHGYPTSVVFHDNGIESVEKIHGHSGSTRIEWVTDDVVDALEDVVNQSCWNETDQLLDSMALSAYAHGLRVLADLDRVTITNDVGRRVIAKWVETQ